MSCCAAAMQTRFLAVGALGVALLLGSACGRTVEWYDAAGSLGGLGESAGSAAVSGNAGGSAGSAGSMPLAGAAGMGGAAPRVPMNHRATANACDATRPSVEPMLPEQPSEAIQCRSHADCTEGKNGRCMIVGHAWQCTYDACFTDLDCPSSGSLPQVCQCEGGLFTDNNVCLSTGCQVDADCGDGGYCSPTLGSCGNYLGVVAYYCHTKDDECIDDSDCSAQSGYCAYQPTVGHWQCSTTQCLG